MPTGGRADAPVMRDLLLLLHLAAAAPLVALAAWFGLVDSPAFDEGRCSSCGVEGYVIAAHVAAAVWLAAVVACVAALRRDARAPGPITIRVLAAAGAFMVACLVWPDLFKAPATVALLTSLLLIPLAALFWTVEAVRLWRHPPQAAAGTDRHLTFALAQAWVSLLVLLPAVFAWVWVDRVDWIVF
jgi:hypothetical protein